MNHLLTILAFIALAPVAPGVVVAFEWDASPTPDVTYRLHVVGQTTSFDFHAGARLFASVELECGQCYTITVTAVNASQLESEPSNAIVLNPHTHTRIIVGTELLESPSVGGPFRPTGATEIELMDPTDAAHFWTARATITTETEEHYE